MVSSLINNFAPSPSALQASTFAAQLYDVVFLYGLGLHAALQDGYSPANGSQVVKYMKNATFDGV